jgi:hypothetical protein
VARIANMWERTPVPYNLYREIVHKDKKDYLLFITDKAQRKKWISNNYEPMSIGFDDIMEFVNYKIYSDVHPIEEEIDDDSDTDSDTDNYSDDFESEN